MFPSRNILHDETARLMMGSIILAFFITILVYIFVFSNETLVNKIFEESFSNKDYIDGEDSYDNKYLLEQKIFNMLKPINQKKYLNLSEAAKDAFLTDITLNKI